MEMTMRRFNFVLLLFLAIGIPARAEWPSRVFAPYLFLGAGDDFKLTDCEQACGLKYYTLAFIIARQEGNGQNARYHSEPSWNGRVPMKENLYKDQIDAVRKTGGDVIVSFGGEGGRELAMVEPDTTALTAAYQAIIDRYGFTWLDFDIEGDSLKKYPDVNQRRNAALVTLQTRNPGLRISYTLPVDPDGISTASEAMLADGKAKGLKIYSADLMVMYFGKKFINKGKSEGELGIDSAKKAYSQIQKIDPLVRIGLCPCLGNNGSSEEVFTLDDAKTLMAFAEKTPWVCSFHFWSINDDSGKRRRRRQFVANGATNSAGMVITNSTSAAVEVPRQPWVFANLLQSFSAGHDQK
jgi:chitinase